MTLTGLLTRPCTLLVRTDSGATDEDGNEIPTETELETVCYLEQASSNEPGAGGELAVSDWRAIFPPGTAYRTGDALLVDELELEAIGDPAAFEAPAGFGAALDHVEGAFRQTRGAANVS